MTPTYQFPFLEDCHSLAQTILTEKTPVAVYGLGLIGKKTISELQALDLPVLMVIDQYFAESMQDYQGIPVKTLDALSGGSTPVVICSENFYDEMKERLTQKGFTQILPYYFYLSGKKMDYESFLPIVRTASFAENRRKIQALAPKSPVILESLDVVITEKCSLRCKDCSNLMQYFTNPQDASLTDTLTAAGRLLNSVDFIYELRILGGEPFVNPELALYIKSLLAQKNFGMLVIFTNGTILPKEETLSCLKDPRVFVSISNYGEVSRRLSELASTLHSQQIFYSVSDFSNWTDCSKIGYQNRSIAELKKVYQSCCVFNLFSLKDGKLFQCPLIGNAAALKAIPKDAIECIDLLAPGITKTQIQEGIFQMQHKEYLPACNYCPGRPRGIADIPAALQAGAPLPYQKYEDD